VSTAQRSVLIVDDDVDFRETLEALLADEGYGVIATGDPREALDMLRDVAPVCLVLVDLVMPVMNGEELVRAIRGEPRWRDLPIYVLSAWPQSQAHVDGAQGYLEKPVRFETLLSVLDRWCRADAWPDASCTGAPARDV
jgi:CheY-like chemotaxis protein